MQIATLRGLRRELIERRLSTIPGWHGYALSHLAHHADPLRSASASDGRAPTVLDLIERGKHLSVKAWRVPGIAARTRSRAGVANKGLAGHRVVLGVEEEPVALVMGAAHAALANKNAALSFPLAVLQDPFPLPSHRPPATVGTTLARRVVESALVTAERGGMANNVSVIDHLLHRDHGPKALPSDAVEEAPAAGIGVWMDGELVELAVDGPDRGRVGWRRSGSNTRHHVAALPWPSVATR